MSQLRTLLVALLVVLTLGLPSTLASAQPGEGGAESDDHAVGKELAISGFDAYKAGNFEDALKSFEKASELYPTGQVLRMLGYTLLALERWLEAAEVLERAVGADFKPLPEELLGEVRTNLDKALSHLATVTVRSDVDGAVVSVDGGESQPLPVDGLRLAEGRHSFQASADGYEDVEQDVELTGGETATLELNFQKASTTTATPAPGPLRKPEPDRSGGPGPWRAIGMATGGVGLLMAGIGVATLVSGTALDESVQDRKTLYELRYASGCPAADYELCAYDAAAINNQVDQAGAMQTAGLTLSIVGGALLVAGVVMIVVAPDDAPADDRQASAPLACGPFGLTGVGCVGTF